MSSSPADTKLRFALPVVLAAPLLFVLRLHLLVRMDLALDGDEAVVGLMSLHVLQGEGLPLFFYGQNYGLSGLEAVSGALWFALLDVSAGALRVAMLLLWALGGAFLVAAAARLGNRASAWWALGLMATSPAWLEWSMKARGGYMTAFLFFSASVWLAARLRGRGGWPWLALGACCAVVLFSQALWFPALLALVGALWWERRDAAAAGLWAGGAGAMGVLLLLAAGGTGYWSPGLAQQIQPLRALMHLPERLFTLFHGAYLYEESQPIGWVSGAAGTAWLFAWLALTVILTACVVRRRSTPLQRAGLVALLAAPMLSLVMSFPGFGSRYLLSVSVVLILLLALEAGSPRRTLAAAGARWVVGILVLMGFLALGDRSVDPLQDDGSSAYAMDAAHERILLDELRRRGIHQVYSLDPLLPWNLAFASREEIVGRWFSWDDRVPAYPRAVDRALQDGRPVGLVGRSFQEAFLLERSRLAGLPEPRRVRLAGGLFLVEQPDATLLRALGFQLEPESG